MTWLVDLAIALTLAEAAFLVLRHRQTGRGSSPALVLPNLAAGAFLLIGLRAALAGGGFVWIAACLAGSGIAHALDLRARQGRG